MQLHLLLKFLARLIQVSVGFGRHGVISRLVLRREHPLVLVLVIFAVVVHAVCCYWNEGVQAFVYTAAVALDSRVAAYVVSVRRPRPTRELGFVAFQSKKIVELCLRASLLERPRVLRLERACDGAAVFTPSIDEGLLDRLKTLLSAPAFR